VELRCEHLTSAYLRGTPYYEVHNQQRSYAGEGYGATGEKNNIPSEWGEKL